MILPTKHISHISALMTSGANLLRLLDKPKTVSALWDEIHKSEGGANSSGMYYDGFVLALDLLYMMGAITLADGVIYRGTP